MNRVTKIVKRVFSEPSPLRFVVSRFLLRLKIDLPFKLTFYKQLDVKTYFHASSAAHKLFIKKYKPKLDLAVFNNFIKEGMTVFDVGANIGMFSVVAAKLSRTGLIYAFEATPKTFSYLLDNIRLNKAENIYPVYAAVCNEKGLVSFYEHENSHEQNYITDDVRGTVRVPALPLNSFFKSVNVSQIDFLKIDVEGAELSVIKSASDIMPFIKVIYFEYTNDNSDRFGYGEDELIDYVCQFNFDIFIPNLSNDELILKPYQKSERNVKNLLAIKK